MSKRVANTKARTARFGRVRIGWRKQKLIDQFGNIEKAMRMQGESMDDEAREKMTATKNAIMKIVPKRFLRRHQGR